MAGRQERRATGHTAHPPPNGPKMPPEWPTGPFGDLPEN